MDDPTDTQPALVVVRGHPDAVELAALTAVLLVRLRARTEAEEAYESDGALGTAPRAPWGAPRRVRPRVGWTAP
ncbi:acyl-CoA carboxylase subunit epsilon [Streptomyces sp. NPDC005931]|uniref:acyl-CoA carboxylase subunit epsilon n=1 Tax=Streptomyces sp. NPDC005931 TaxID=3364737 RepID=UPI0036BAC4DD